MEEVDHRAATAAALNLVAQLTSLLVSKGVISVAEALTIAEAAGGGDAKVEAAVKQVLKKG